MLAENILIGEGTKYPLKGVLTLPDNLSVPVPAVVLIHGSGSSNMDEKVGKLTPFKDIAEGLARHGVASIRYDKRSFVHGLKMVRDKNLTITAKEETIDDAVLATQLLKSDSRIDSSKVFVIGHSMGGTLAPRIDAEGGDYRGLIIMAGTPRRLEDVMKEQLAENLDQMNPILRKIASGSINKMLKKFDGM
ncbi:MAG: alpha/beta fold hydrolase, partial [Oscillospiraceae bacterium]|nr:alpha/beta fold hydrolase [Oscillospiraceae bacterium]